MPTYIVKRKGPVLIRVEVEAATRPQALRVARRLFELDGRYTRCSAEKVRDVRV